MLPSYRTILVYGDELPNFKATMLNIFFYLSCNCIFSKTAKCDQLLQLRLQETYCLPVISYAAAVISLSKSHLQRLNSGWNSVYRRIFGFKRMELGEILYSWFRFFGLKTYFYVEESKVFLEIA